MRRLWVGAAMVATMALAGCANPAEMVAERVIEQQAGDGVKVDLDTDGDGGGVSVENEDGSYKAGTHAEVPASFPADLPLPDAEVTLAMEESDTWSVMFADVSVEDAKKIFAHFDDGDFERAYFAETEGTTHGTYQDATRDISIVHMDDDGTFMYAVGPRTNID